MTANTDSCECHIWFDRSMKQISSLSDLWAVHEMLSAGEQPNASTSQRDSSERKRKRPLDDQSSMVPFKNVKLVDSAVICVNSVSGTSPQQRPDAIYTFTLSLSDSETSSVDDEYTAETEKVGLERRGPSLADAACSCSVKNVKVVRRFSSWYPFITSALLMITLL